jgi:hypothetical protein
VLKSLAILPSGSAGKFLKKIWNLGQLGGEEANFASVLRPPPHSVPSANFCAKKCFILTVPMDRAFFFDRHLTAVLTAVLKNRKKY